MSWDTKTQIAEDLSATDTEVFSDAVSLKSEEVAHVQVEADFPGGPTDDLEIRVYSTLDATSETWDTESILDLQTLDNATDPGMLSFNVSSVYKFRVGFKATGATDTIVVNAHVRLNGLYKDCSLDI